MGCFSEYQRKIGNNMLLGRDGNAQVSKASRQMAAEDVEGFPQLRHH